MDEIGRNAPCPCGSGKKYKKCCLPAQAAEVDRSPGHEWNRIEGKLAPDLLRFAQNRFGDEVREAFEEYPGDAHDDLEIPLFAPWLLFERRFDGRTIARGYLEERGHKLSARERSWLEAEGRGWLSIWEVTDVEPGKGVEVKDLLTGEVRSITDVSGSKLLKPNLLLLTRVVDHDGLSLFDGTHSRPLPPEFGAALVKAARKELQLPKRVAAEALRADGIALELIELWADAVEELDSRPPPRLQTTDGEELVMVKDRFELRDRMAGAAVAERVARMEGVERFDEGGEQVFTFTKKGNKVNKGWDNTVLGHLRLGQKAVTLETSSRERADRLRAALEAACGDLVRHDKREETDPRELMAMQRGQAHPPGGEVAGPEVDALLMSFKEKHYEGWLDEPVPALDDLTPREAALNATARAKLVALLKDMETTEQREPAGRRYAFTRLRQALGLAGDT